MLAPLFAAALLGVVIGILSGLLGIGGGTVMVPVFRLLFGMQPLVSTATSLFTIIPTSISGVISHVRGHTCVPVLGIVMGIGGACTSPAGVWLARLSPAWVVMLVAAVVIAYSAVSMLRKGLRTPVASQETEALSVQISSSAPVHKESFAVDRGSSSHNVSLPADQDPPSATVQTIEAQQQSLESASLKGMPHWIVKGVVIGLVAGLISGYIGVGGGFIMVPLMGVLLNFPMTKASGTSLIAVMILAIPGAITQGLLGNIDYGVGIACAIGSIPGAYVGAKLITRISERNLRLVFAAFLLVAACGLVVAQ